MENDSRQKLNLARKVGREYKRRTVLVENGSLESAESQKVVPQDALATIKSLVPRRLEKIVCVNVVPNTC